MRVGDQLLNRDIKILDKNSLYFDQWLTVRKFDGEYYFATGSDISEITPMFDITQFTYLARQYSFKKPIPNFQVVN